MNKSLPKAIGPVLAIQERRHKERNYLVARTVKIQDQDGDESSYEFYGKDALAATEQLQPGDHVAIEWRYTVRPWKDREFASIAGLSLRVMKPSATQSGQAPTDDSQPGGDLPF